MLEDAYLQPMVWALEKRGFEIETEVPPAIEFEGQIVQRAYIIDVVVKRGEINLEPLRPFAPSSLRPFDPSN